MTTSFQKNNLYTLEEHIMNVWSLVDQLELIRWGLLDKEIQMSEDAIDNAILGTHTLLSLACEKLFKQYEAVLKDRINENNI